MMRVIGAGVGRTGTTSLKAAFERLLGGRCYHMVELLDHAEHSLTWRAAARGRMPQWHELMAPYVAAVDWPAAAFWPELKAAFPDALVLLSVRDPASWWASVQRSIAPSMRRPNPSGRHMMLKDILTQRFVVDLDDQGGAIDAFKRHNEAVRRAIPPGQLIEWTIGDGWEPLCRALGVAVPPVPFPCLNAGTHLDGYERLWLRGAMSSAGPVSERNDASNVSE